MGTGGVPGFIFLLWEVWMADWMFWCRCWHWLWGRFFWVGWSCSNSVCVASVAMREKWAGLLLPGG